MKRLRIGIVGCGAIGSSLAKAIVGDFAKEAELVGLFDLDISKSEKLAGVLSKKIVMDKLVQLISKSDLVIEAASAASSWDISQKTLNAGKDIMVMSVGGLVDRLVELKALARINKARVYIPSGAISGVDALKAANSGKIISVTLTTTKNPRAFKGVKYIEEKGLDIDKLISDKLLFSGTAEEAVKYFPQNINVAAVLSLAGIGAKKTIVQIIASPSTDKNIHEIRIESEAGNIFTRTENVLHPENPKTSYLAVLAAIATLKQILEPVRIGS